MIQEDGVIYKDEVVFSDGTVYKGQCKEVGKDEYIKHGYGVLVFPDGAKYQGYFVNGV